MTCKNPFSTLSEGSEEIKYWIELLDKLPDLAYDMAVGSKAWDTTQPWQDIHRDQYTEKEAPVEERWDMLILGSRTMKEVQATAADGCRKSKIELAHLERGKCASPAVIESASALPEA
jgi:hypothetical protein